MNDRPGSGLIVLDKPVGLSSHDCVLRVRRTLKQTRIGHAGTLDPLASGVLLVLVGESTAAQDRYMGLEKEYRLRAQFGCRTVSGDRDGRPLPAAPYRPVTFDALEKMLRAFEGPQWQPPPRVAAAKIKGKPLYEWSRRGIELDREPKPIEIHRCELTELRGAFWEARVVCSKGTYIRALVEDIAAQLDTCAVLDQLVRERVGRYRRQVAWTLEGLSGAAQDGHLESIYA